MSEYEYNDDLSPEERSKKAKEQNKQVQEEARKQVEADREKALQAQRDAVGQPTSTAPPQLNVAPEPENEKNTTRRRTSG